MLLAFIFDKSTFLFVSLDSYAPNGTIGLPNSLGRAINDLGALYAM